MLLYIVVSLSAFYLAVSAIPAENVHDTFIIAALGSLGGESNVVSPLRAQELISNAKTGKNSDSRLLSNQGFGVINSYYYDTLLDDNCGGIPYCLHSFNLDTCIPFNNNDTFTSKMYTGASEKNGLYTVYLLSFADNDCNAFDTGARINFRPATCNVGVISNGLFSATFELNAVRPDLPVGWMARSFYSTEADCEMSTDTSGPYYVDAQKTDVCLRMSLMSEIYSCNADGGVHVMEFNGPTCDGEPMMEHDVAPMDQCMMPMPDMTTHVAGFASISCIPNSHKKKAKKTKSSRRL